MNISDATKETVTFQLAFGSSSSDDSLKYSKKELTVSTKVAAEANGWVKLADDLAISNKYMLVTVYDTMHFNEIVLLNSEHTAFSVTMPRAGERSANHASGKEYDLEDHTGHDHSVEEKTEEERLLADKIIDEQKDFVYATVEDLYKKALEKNPTPVSVEETASDSVS